MFLSLYWDCKCISIKQHSKLFLKYFLLLFIDDLLDQKELTLDTSSNYMERSNLINEIQNLDTILDEIFNLYEKEDEEEQIKQTT